MASLTFQQALARGMLPKAKSAQTDLINLAGGTNTFRSEDWWNKAVDTQISKGYRTVKETGKEYLLESGEYQLGNRQTRYNVQSPFGSAFGPTTYTTQKPYMSSYGGPLSGAPKASTSYQPPEGAAFTIDPRTKQKIYTTREIDIFGNRKDFTAQELKSIEKAAKRGGEQVKVESAKMKASRRRLSRATGGLMGKAKVGEPELGPALGTTGLNMEDSILGGGIKL